jgi:hypothetical protein
MRVEFDPLRLFIIAADASVACRQIIQEAGTQRKSDPVLLAPVGVSFPGTREQRFAPSVFLYLHHCPRCPDDEGKGTEVVFPLTKSPRDFFLVATKNEKRGLTLKD